MFFKDIEIKGFRGINQLKIDNLKDINLIVGKNNCGKTSVLEAIFLLTGISNSELIPRINLYRDLIITDSEDLRNIFFNLDYNSELILKADLFKPYCYRELRIVPSSIIKLEVDKNKKNGKSISSDSSTTSQKEINELLLNFSIKDGSSQKREYQSKLQLFNNNQVFISANNYLETMKGNYLTPHAQVYVFENLIKQIDTLIRDKNEKEIINILSKIEKNIKNISFGANQIIYLDIGLDKLIPLNIIGDGIRRILSVILGIYNAKNGILLIDELENGLYYSNLKHLWKSIIEASRKFNVQLFITTHNFETLKYLKEAAEESTNEDKQRICSITLRKMEDGNVKAYNYDFEKFDFSLEQGIEIR